MDVLVKVEVERPIERSAVLWDASAHGNSVRRHKAGIAHDGYPRYGQSVCFKIQLEAVSEQE
jgi:hypothetical protein